MFSQRSSEVCEPLYSGNGEGKEIQLRSEVEKWVRSTTKGITRDEGDFDRSRASSREHNKKSIRRDIINLGLNHLGVDIVAVILQDWEFYSWLQVITFTLNCILAIIQVTSRLITQKMVAYERDAIRRNDVRRRVKGDGHVSIHEGLHDHQSSHIPAHIHYSTNSELAIDEQNTIVGPPTMKTTSKQ